jgi:hypothetical protein
VLGHTNTQGSQERARVCVCLHAPVCVSACACVCVCMCLCVCVCACVICAVPLVQVLEQTKEIQGNTTAALADQRQQMHRIEDDLDKVGDTPPFPPLGPPPLKAMPTTLTAAAVQQQQQLFLCHVAQAPFQPPYLHQHWWCSLLTDSSCKSTSTRHQPKPQYIAVCACAAPPVLTPTTLPPLQMGQDLTYSERILRFMKLCCCVGFFCSCCTEPGRSGTDKKWRGR